MTMLTVNAGLSAMNLTPSTRRPISISMDREAGQCLSRSLRRFSRRQVGPRVSVRRQAIEPIPIDLDRRCAPRIRQVAVGLGEVGEQAFATVNKGALAKRCKASLEIVRKISFGHCRI